MKIFLTENRVTRDPTLQIETMSGIIYVSNFVEALVTTCLMVLTYTQLSQIMLCNLCNKLKLLKNRITKNAT